MLKDLSSGLVITHRTLERRCYNVVLSFWRPNNVVVTPCVLWGVYISVYSVKV